MQEIIIIGGGGHCKSCIDVLETENNFRIAGIVDVREKLHQKVLDYEIIASDEDLPELAREYNYFLITIGQIKSPERRIEKFEHLKKLGATFPVIVSPTAHVSKHSSIGAGTIIMHNAVVNAGVTIGENCIINTGTIIEHDAIIGNHCHISTGAIINGGTIIKEKIFFGSNSMAREYIEIGENSLIGGGISVKRSVNPNSVLKTGDI